MSGLRNRKAQTAPAQPPEDSDLNSLSDDQGKGGEGNKPESTDNGVSEQSLPYNRALTVLQRHGHVTHTK